MHIYFLLMLTSLAVTRPSPINQPPSEVGTPCGGSLGDCPNLTCIPLSTNCTAFSLCPGTCQDIDATKQQIYTLCGGWGLLDDCDERIEHCISDPRHRFECGPSCDGMGICAPLADWCSAQRGEEKKCSNDKACFYNGDQQFGWCFPLMFGSDDYDKTGAYEVIRTDQDGYQKPDEPTKTDA
jgi:hypothetical protein